MKAADQIKAGLNAWRVPQQKQRRWLMGWASPHDGSEEEAVTAWGRPAPDTTAAILADSIRFASSAVIPIPLLSPSFSWKLRSSRRRRRKQEKEDIFDVVLRRGKSRANLFDLVIGPRFSFFFSWFVSEEESWHLTLFQSCHDAGTWVLSALINPTLVSVYRHRPLLDWFRVQTQERELVSMDLDVNLYDLI